MRHLHRVNQGFSSFSFMNLREMNKLVSFALNSYDRLGFLLSTLMQRDFKNHITSAIKKPFVHCNLSFDMFPISNRANLPKRLICVPAAGAHCCGGVEKPLDSICKQLKSSQLTKSLFEIALKPLSLEV